MCGADGARLDPTGLPVALCPVAPGVFVQKSTGEHKTSVQDLPLQTGNTHNKKNEQVRTVFQRELISTNSTRGQTYNFYFLLSHF